MASWGLDNFNSYYPVGLKFDRAKSLEELGVYTFQALKKTRLECSKSTPLVLLHPSLHVL